MSMLGEFSVRIYESPFTEIRESGAIADVTKPIHVLMLVMDFVTELEMNGIANFIGNSTGRFANETVAALRLAVSLDQAQILEKIVGIAQKAGMTHAAIQQESSGLPEFSITSFQQLHGLKWEDASRQIDVIADQIDVGEIYSALETYCHEHQREIAAAMSVCVS